MKADAQSQARLLDLQALDTRLDQLAHARARLPRIAELADLRDKASVIDTEIVRVRTAYDDIQREVAKAEADVQQVRDRAARDEAHLASGKGTAKELTALQHELVSLARRQAELEDVELEVMERAEALESDLQALQSGRDRLTGSIEATEAALSSETGVIDDEAAQVSARRAGLVAQVGSELVGLYEQLRQTHGGVGAALLSHRRCGGCQLELNAVELAQITATPADEVVRCEECRRILVRTGESGLR